MGNIKQSEQSARAAGKWSGGKWASNHKRLAIYVRDGFACAYCGHTVENGAQLALDHIVPHKKGGTNVNTNLVTACKRCNTSKHDRDLDVFVPTVVAYIDNGRTADFIYAHVADCAARDMTQAKAEAKRLIALRGTCARAVAAIAIPE